MDVERVVWEYMVEVACNDWEFADWGNGNKTSTPVCEQSKKCFKDIFGLKWDGSGVGERENVDTEGFYSGGGLT